MPEAQPTPAGRRQAALERRDLQAKVVDEPDVEIVAPEVADEVVLGQPGHVDLEEGAPPVEEGPTADERIAVLEALVAELTDRLAVVETPTRRGPRHRLGPDAQ